MNNFDFECYQSLSQNPFENLAIEHRLFEQVKTGLNSNLVFFYINRPCVVMGRFQNPWQQCHMKYLEKNNILLLRRTSGGGCVYHDLGNLNFCFLTRGHELKKNDQLLYLQSCLQAWGLSVLISPRGDLVIDDQGINKKISGQAFRQTKNACLHHGTLLFHADLNRLRESLKIENIGQWQTKALPSFPMSVMNMSQCSEKFQIDSFLAHFLQYSGQKSYKRIDVLPSDRSRIEELSSWDWIIGETPQFSWHQEYEWGECEVVANRGRVKNWRWNHHQLHPTLLNESAKRLIGLVLRSESIFPIIEQFYLEYQVDRESQLIYQRMLSDIPFF